MASRIKPLKDKFLSILEAAGNPTAPSRNYIANLYPWHCQESVYTLSNYAFSRQRSARGFVVCIVAHTLLDAFFDEKTVTTFTNYMNHGGSLKILLARRPADKCGQVLKELEVKSEEFKRRGGTLPCPGLELQVSPIIDCTFPQFMIVGDSAYRVEAAHEPIYDSSNFKKDFPELPARVCFNDFQGGQKLKISFDLLWQVAADKSVGREAFSSAVQSFEVVSNL